MTGHRPPEVAVSETIDPVSATEPAFEQLRSARRDSMFLLSPLRRPGGEDVIVKVRNLSAGGLMAESPVAFMRGDPIEVELRGIGLVTGTVAWTAAGRVGVAFDRTVDPSCARKPVAGRPQQQVLMPTARSTWRPPVR
jgi:hypothetical protein